MSAPIVAAAVGGVPDVVSQEQAALVAPERPDALAIALDQIASDPAAAEARAARAGARLRSERGVDRWLAAYDAVYHGLVPLPPPAA